MQVKTSTLTSIALDWVVSTTQGNDPSHSAANCQAFLRHHAKGTHHYATPGSAADRIIQAVGIDTRYIKPKTHETLELRHLDRTKGDTVFRPEGFNRDMVKRPSSPRDLDGKWMAQLSTTSSSTTPQWSTLTASTGSTPTEAAMRCWVHSQYGPVVDIPDLIAQRANLGLETSMGDTSTPTAQLQALNPLTDLIANINEHLSQLDEISKSHGPLSSHAAAAKPVLHKLLDASEKLRDNTCTLPDFQKLLTQASPVNFAVIYDIFSEPSPSISGTVELQTSLPDGTLFAHMRKFVHKVDDPAAPTLLGSQLDTENSKQVIDFDNEGSPIEVDGIVLDQMVLDSIPGLEDQVPLAIMQAARLRALEQLAQQCNATADDEACEAFSQEAGVSPSEFITLIQERGYTSHLLRTITPQATADNSLEQAASATAQPTPRAPRQERDDGPSLG